LNRYALRGWCKFGDNCFFVHDVPQNNASPTPPVCKYFLEGRCRFGNNCVYSHNITNVEANDSNEISNSSSNFSSPTQADERSSTNSDLVVRLKNKPKLVTAFNSAKSEQETQSTFNTEQNYALESNANQLMHTPSSYYEALTGKKYPTNIDLNELDGNIFDENYIEYLRRKQTSNETQTHTNLCPYFEKTMNCPFGDTCEYVHGELCDICNMPCLNPFDPEQCESHRKDCMSVIEKDMQEAFAAQCSAQKACGVCMEIVWDKEKESDRRFGILENCNHIFCLACIRKWRSSKSYENKIVKACPECRVKSDFVTPSRFWFEDEDNKRHIIEEYKTKLGFVNFLFIFSEFYSFFH
jgi:E3 ubiquitin-protein ligase makorin